ncbi:MAG: hypothetical protein HYZ29_34405 [Myxococcales bacterium]|nr:hypothetical protein [Myxococcales bacterium]
MAPAPRRMRYSGILARPVPNVHLITLPKLERARGRVVPELRRHGFWCPAVERVHVRLVWFGTAYGWKWDGHDGHIEIPAASTAKLGDWLSGSYTSIADVLRHEYGHAVADTHRALVRSSRFREVFGASHDDPTPFEHDHRFHVTQYAATRASEDFAEVFMFYLKHDGRRPARMRSAPIAAKWRFVRELGAAVRRGQRRW